MEASFPYEETVDQLRAVAEVKADMEQARPMDRLVVGDVGYGKTEVALRAAFKAIQDGKQVAVLVPTTVLAAQHHATFSQRFAAFPLEVRLLSRFVSAKEQAATLDGLADGTVDVVIGTHRLLSQGRPRSRTSGLVVVDEEQRFGVAAKERLKQLRSEVDVLTLSATPIPRTLNLALAGIRDLSVIETPPEDRLPIQTRVAEASAGLVRDAILRELDRGGQVFYVHNRVETIEAQAEQLRRLLPGARFVVGHGQMTEGALEKVMIGVRRRRGRRPRLHDDHRVRARHPERQHDRHRPRRHARAGAALPAPRPGRPEQPARLRLPPLPAPRAAVATRRASGSRPSSTPPSWAPASRSPCPTSRSAAPATSWAASSPGTWPPSASTSTRGCWPRRSRTRKADLRGPRRRSSSAPQAVVDLPVEAHLPTDYVPDEAQKLELYRRLARARTPGDLAAFRQEVTDRFGPMPTPVARLVEVAELRLAAEAAGVAVDLARGGLARRPLRGRADAGDRDAPAGRPGPAGRPSRRHVRLQPGPDPAAARPRQGLGADPGGRRPAHRRRERAAGRLILGRDHWRAQAPPLTTRLNATTLECERR